MKVRLLVDCEGPNPHFDPTQPADELNPHTIPIPAGTEIEDKHAWLLCFPEFGAATGRAEPIDDEAKRRIAFEAKRNARLKTAQEVLAIAKEEAAVAAEQAPKES